MPGFALRRSLHVHAYVMLSTLYEKYIRMPSFRPKIRGVAESMFEVDCNNLQVQAELEQRSIEAAEALVDIGQEGCCIFDVGKCFEAL